MAKPLVISVAESCDGGASHVFVFDRGPVVVGRDPGTSLVIDRGVVSGVHGVFEIAANGAVTFCDLGSRNGTLLNGRSLRPDDAAALCQQDILTIGYLRLQLLDERPEAGFGPEAVNPFAPEASPGAPTSLPDETAAASPAEVAAARAFGRVAAQEDALPSAQPPPDEGGGSTDEGGGSTQRMSSLAPHLDDVWEPAAPEVAPGTRDLPLANAGGTAIMVPGHDASLHRAEPHRKMGGSEIHRSAPARSRAQRGRERRVKRPTVVSRPRATGRLAWVGIAAGVVILSAVVLRLVLPREHEPTVASPTFGASDESREAPKRAVVPTPAAPAESEPHRAFPSIAAPSHDVTPSSIRAAQAPSALAAPTAKQPYHSERPRPRRTDAQLRRNIGEVGIMP